MVKQQTSNGGQNMISSGYFAVSKETLFRLTKKQALQFITEMFEHGGRISHYEYMAWVQWINASHSFIA